jgi:hypothetical protein
MKSILIIFKKRDHPIQTKENTQGLGNIALGYLSLMFHLI